MRRQLAVLVLTEDNGADAHAAVCELVRKVLLVLEPDLDVDERHLTFGKADERAREAMGFNCYNSPKPANYAKKVSLAQAIANHLLTDERDAAVFAHIDGDGPWSGRDPVHLCANHRLFTEEIVRRVQAILEKQRQPQRLQQIATLVPFWSIESWLYQNFREALSLCQEHPKYRRDAHHFEAWQAAPHLLDEHERPKDTIRFGNKYNLHLARAGFPARRLHQLGLSFAASVEAARPGLRALLAGHTRHSLA